MHSREISDGACKRQSRLCRPTDCGSPTVLACAVFAGFAQRWSLRFRRKPLHKRIMASRASPIELVIGYQPYYTESWSGVIMRDKKYYEKYLPKGSNVSFQIGLQGAIIVNGMLAGKVDIGYVGDMPGIVSTSHPDVRDVRIVSVLGLGYDQCNIFLARPDAPQFKSPEEAIKWLNGKTVAVPKGSCTDRFAQAVFKRFDIKPSEYLNQSIEVITSGFRAKKLDAAVIWEPTASRLVQENLARKVATGAAVNELDGGFMVMPQALIEQRPDVAKAWLEAELDAVLYFGRLQERHGHRQDGGQPDDRLPGEGVVGVSVRRDRQGGRRHRHAHHAGLRIHAAGARSHSKGLEIPRRYQEHQGRDPAGGSGAAADSGYSQGARPPGAGRDRSRRFRTLPTPANDGHCSNRARRLRRELDTVVISTAPAPEKARSRKTKAQKKKPRHERS